MKKDSQPTFISSAFFVFGYDDCVIENIVKTGKPILIFKNTKFLHEKTIKFKTEHPNIKGFNPATVVDELYSTFHPKIYLIQFKNFL